MLFESQSRRQPTLAARDRGNPYARPPPEPSSASGGGRSCSGREGEFGLPFSSSLPGRAERRVTRQSMRRSMCGKALWTAGSSPGGDDFSSSLPGRATDPGLSVPTRIACAIERVAGGNTARVTVGTLRFAHPTRCARLLNEPVRPFLHRVAAITSDQPTDGTSAHEPLLPRGGERPASVPTYSPWTEGTSILPSCGTGSDRSSNTRPHGRRSIMFRLSFSCIIRASFPKSG